MKVYWSRCGHGHGNFGDKITPLLLRHAGIPVAWSPPEQADLIGAGSILEKVPARFRGTLWTAGFMHESSRAYLPQAHVLGLRGKLSLARLEPASDTIILGDAGLLVAELTGGVRKKHKLGVVPHFVDNDDPMVRALADSSSEVRVIDICAETFEVMHAVAECEYIVSSSLHGLVLADSFAIPNRWVELNRGLERVTGSGFKFRDYYSVFGMAPEPMHLTSESNLDSVLAGIPEWKRPGVAEVQSRLRDSLKQIAASVAPPSTAEQKQRETALAEWVRRSDSAQRAVRATIRDGALAVIADDEQFRSNLTEICTRPFLERNGVYWGPPESAEKAVGELQRQVADGAKWFVLAWPMFWLKEENSTLARFLGSTARLVYTSDAVEIYRWP